MALLAFASTSVSPDLIWEAKKGGGLVGDWYGRSAKEDEVEDDRDDVVNGNTLDVSEDGVDALDVSDNDGVAVDVLEILLSTLEGVGTEKVKVSGLGMDCGVGVKGFGPKPEVDESLDEDGGDGGGTRLGSFRECFLVREVSAALPSN